MLAGLVGFLCWVTWRGSEPRVIVLAGIVGSLCWVTWRVSETGMMVLAGAARGGKKKLGANEKNLRQKKKAQW